MAIIYELSNTRFFFIRSAYGLALGRGKGVTPFAILILDNCDIISNEIIKLWNI